MFDVSQKEAAELFKCSERTLERRRQEGILIEGIHWGKSPSGKIVYRSKLLSNLAACGNDHQHPDHIRLIFQILQSENPPKSKGRRQKVQAPVPAQ